MKILRFLAFAITPLAVLPAFAQTIQVNKDNRTIAITTSDQAEAVADVAVITVGFSSYGVDQDQTYADAPASPTPSLKPCTMREFKPDAIESANQNLAGNR